MLASTGMASTTNTPAPNDSRGVARVISVPRIPPSVQALWKVGRIGWATRCSSATACMLVPASTIPRQSP